MSNAIGLCERCGCSPLGVGSCRYGGCPYEAALSEIEPPKRLWLWKNFVDGKPEYWAFDNPYPCVPGGGDPLTLGEPCGYAIVMDSTQGRTDVSDDEVIAAIKRASTASATATPMSAHDAAIRCAEIADVLEITMGDLVGNKLSPDNESYNGALSDYADAIRAFANSLAAAPAAAPVGEACSSYFPDEVTGNCIRCGQSQTAHASARPEEKTTWISVSERFPATRIRVTTCARDGFVYDGYIDHDGLWKYTDPTMKVRDMSITHWQPLPKPPMNSGLQEKK